MLTAFATNVKVLATSAGGMLELDPGGSFGGIVMHTPVLFGLATAPSSAASQGWIWTDGTSTKLTFLNGATLANAMTLDSSGNVNVAGTYQIAGTSIFATTNTWSVLQTFSAGLTVSGGAFATANGGVAPTVVTVPASGTAYTPSSTSNTVLTVSGGTVTVIAINGVTTGLLSGTFYMKKNDTITFTYSVAPTVYQMAA